MSNNTVRSSVDSNLTSLFLQFPAMVAIFEGPELRCTYANPQFTKLYPGRKILGKTPREIAPELNDQGYVAMMEQVCQTGKPFYGNADPATADWNSSGQPFTKYFNFAYSPYKIEGQSVGVIAFGLEITEHIVAKKAATDHQLLVNTISSAAPTCPWICDENMDCIFVNETWIRWTGKPLEYHMGARWATCMSSKEVGPVLREG